MSSSTWTSDDFESSSSDDDFKITLTEEEIASLARRGYTMGSSCLGTGSYGKVYRGTLCGERIIAIKQVILKNNRILPVLFEMIALKRVHHRFAVRLLDFFLVQGRHLLIFMEYLGGGDLMKLLRVNEGAIEESMAAYYYLQFGDALAFMHQRGLAHRDLKPENILLTEGWRVAKLADYGLTVESYDLATGEPLKRDTWAGTRYYMSPELILIVAQCYTDLLGERKPYCPFQADIWAVGMILYELLHAKSRKFPYVVPDPWEYQDAYIAITEMYTRIPGRTPIQNIKFAATISDDAQNFTCRHLEWRPTDRPDMDDLLESYWLAVKGKEAEEALSKKK